MVFRHRSIEFSMSLRTARNYFEQKLASPIRFETTAFNDANIRNILAVSKAWSLTFGDASLGSKLKKEISSRLYQ